jgi:hypothetical protein
VTCFDHESDWEGVTVVVDRSKTEAVPVAVHYAEHEAEVSYRWDDLREKWAKPAYARFTAGADQAAVRPLVFSAGGTHASYATLCSTKPCEQVANGAPEATHDGARAWIGNSGECVNVACVQAVPTRKGGSEPALWNAYGGPWGARSCLWKYYCDVGGAPAAPAIRHKRYDDPADCDGLWEPGGGKLSDECYP